MIAMGLAFLFWVYPIFLAEMTAESSIQQGVNCMATTTAIKVFQAEGKQRGTYKGRIDGLDSGFKAS
jgi:hypothetical protein